MCRLANKNESWWRRQVAVGKTPAAPCHAYNALVSTHSSTITPRIWRASRSFDPERKDLIHLGPRVVQRRAESVHHATGALSVAWGELRHPELVRVHALSTRGGCDYEEGFSSAAYFPKKIFTSANFEKHYFRFRFLLEKRRAVPHLRKLVLKPLCFAYISKNGGKKKS